MYVMIFNLKPTAALTFRILPGSILDIATYPFVPPTTLSGFLRRLAMMSAGIEFPNTGPNDANTPFYALPRELIALGAYPTGTRTRPPHRTYRKGPHDLGHTAFSAIYREASRRENIQLHTWEYLLAEQLMGYVISENSQELTRLIGLIGYGAKLGKEGYAFVESTEGPYELARGEIQGKPSTVVPADEVFTKNPQAAADVYTLYSYVWRDPNPDQGQTRVTRQRRQRSGLAGIYSRNAFDQHPSPIVGYKPFVATFLNSNLSVTLDFWSHGEIFIPAMLIDVLRGEVSDEA